MNADDVHCESLVNSEGLRLFAKENGTRWGEFRRGERTLSKPIAKAIVAAAYRLNFLDPNKAFHPLDGDDYFTSLCLSLISNDDELEAIEKEDQLAKIENQRFCETRDKFLLDLTKQCVDPDQLRCAWAGESARFRFGSISPQLDEFYGDVLDFPEWNEIDPDRKARWLEIEIGTSRYDHHRHFTWQKLRSRDAIAFATRDSPQKRAKHDTLERLERSQEMRMAGKRDVEIIDILFEFMLEEPAQNWHNNKTKRVNVKSVEERKIPAKSKKLR